MSDLAAGQDKQVLAHGQRDRGLTVEVDESLGHRRVRPSGLEHCHDRSDAEPPRILTIASEAAER